MNYLGMCCIVKDETPFLEEWLLYHTLLGVERFILYDNCSEVPVAKTLRRYLNPKFLTVYTIPGRARQIPCYNHCLATHGPSLHWLGLCDMDEFFVPRQVDDLHALLTEFEPYSAFACNWKVFGTNGHKTRPEGLQIENYTRCLPARDPMNLHVKVIVKPKDVMGTFSPHVVMHHPGGVTVNELHKPVKGPLSAPASWEKCQINHYYYRSIQDYYLKLRRGMADSHHPHIIPAKIVAPEGDEEDISALRFAPRLLKVLGRAELQVCAHETNEGR